MTIGTLLKAKVDGAIGRYVYTEGTTTKMTSNPNESLTYYILHYLKENLPESNGRVISYSWIFPTLNPEQERSLQTPAVSVRFVSKVHNTLGRYITDVRGNIAKGYLFDGLLEILVMDTSDLTVQDLASKIDNLLLRDGTIPDLFDYISKYTYAHEQGFSDTYKLNFESVFRTPSENQFVYSNVYSTSYTAETEFDQEEIYVHKLKKINALGGSFTSTKKYATFKFKIVD